MRPEALWQDYGIDGDKAIGQVYEIDYIEGEKDDLLLPKMTIDFFDEKEIHDFHQALTVHGLGFENCGTYIEIMKAGE